jgi:hypothetical protein
VKEVWILSYAARLEDNEPARHRRFAIGIAVSVALHAMLLTAFREHSVPLAQPRDPARSIAVWLRPPPAPTPPRTTAIEPSPDKVREHAGNKTHRSRRNITTPSTAAQQVPAIAEEANTVSEVDRPRFDHDSALRTARKIASESAPKGEGQAPNSTYTAESRLVRGIEAAKRRDCKDGLPGGLLGPLIILFDKKDSGCKW